MRLTNGGVSVRGLRGHGRDGPRVQRVAQQDFQDSQQRLLVVAQQLHRLFTASVQHK